MEKSAEMKNRFKRIMVSWARYLNKKISFEEFSRDVNHDLSEFAPNSITFNCSFRSSGKNNISFGNVQNSVSSSNMSEKVMRKESIKFVDESSFSKEKMVKSKLSDHSFSFDVKRSADGRKIDKTREV